MGVKGIKGSCWHIKVFPTLAHARARFAAAVVVVVVVVLIVYAAHFRLLLLPLRSRPFSLGAHSTASTGNAKHFPVTHFVDSAAVAVAVAAAVAIAASASAAATATAAAIVCGPSKSLEESLKLKCCCAATILWPPPTMPQKRGQTLWQVLWGAWQLNFLCGARFDFCALPKLMLQEEEEQQQWLQQIAAGCQKSCCCRLLRLRFKSHGSASRNVINWLLIATAGQSQ